ncbi:glycosyltransferase, partial [Shewanella sp. Isolate13]|uniref:glycosyltransferase n=1 Tax=Shewanella sp. Isolate13 TaxID=2908531 RepID=UPI001EFCCE0D
MKSISIVTHLPFRQKGNQSLLRFVNMFLARGVRVDLFTSGYDVNGQNVIENDLFTLHQLSEGVIQSKQSSEVHTNYSKISSEDIFMPYVNGSFFGFFRKNLSFLVNLYYQTRLKSRIINDFDCVIKNSDVIIGYEANMAFLAKSLAVKYNKRYINKYQGTILAVAKRSLVKAIMYYPTLFWGINSSDLCLMVDDGTDGEYWANKRGNKKVRFRPHGVGVEDYSEFIDAENRSLKFTIFNNASGSTWKRPDRIIRALAVLNKEDLKRINLLTTYSGPDVYDLKKYINELGLDKNVEFLHNLDHVDCNNKIRSSSLVVMTNDLSNLGNPILEAIYFDKPFITLDDGSVNRICKTHEGGEYVKIGSEMDVELAKLISRYINDDEFYALKSRQLKDNTNVRKLEEEQSDEFNWILEASQD